MLSSFASYFEHCAYDEHYAEHCAYDEHYAEHERKTTTLKEKLKEKKNRNTVLSHRVDYFKFSYQGWMDFLCLYILEG